MVFTYYIKLFRTDADRHNSILMALLLLVAETIIKILIQIYYKYTTNILQIYTTISVKRFTLDVWQGSEWASDSGIVLREIWEFNDQNS